MVSEFDGAVSPVLVLQPKGDFMTQDRQLQEAVLAEFLWEPSVTAAHIGVTAHNGVVTLAGHVSNYAEKRAAEKAAARVKGVKAVVEELKVKLHASMVRSDEDIATAAINRLAWDVNIPEGAIKIKVEKGWVTLTGKVDWHFEQQAAERMVRSLHGVLGVFNETTIKPRPDAINIGHNIDRALHRSWFDPKTITVTAMGGKVKLTGSVETPGDRYIAGATAWGAPGATQVENDLLIA
jgi:osmotically-inducible protein OsmY